MGSTAPSTPSTSYKVCNHQEQSIARNNSPPNVGIATYANLAQGEPSDSVEAVQSSLSLSENHDLVLASLAVFLKLMMAVSPGLDCCQQLSTV